jgi:hypothetical protein
LRGFPEGAGVGHSCRSFTHQWPDGRQRWINAAEARRKLATSLRLAQQLGYLETVASDLHLLAAVAATHHNFQLAAHLLGGGERLIEQTGSGQDALEDEIRKRTVAMIQREMPPDRYAEAVQQGYEQGVEAMIEQALAHLG